MALVLSERRHSELSVPNRKSRWLPNSHPFLRGMTAYNGLLAVACGSDLVDLTTGTPGTVAGTHASVGHYERMGRTYRQSATGSDTTVTFSGKRSIATPSHWRSFCAIIQFTSLSDRVIFSDNAGSGGMLVKIDGSGNLQCGDANTAYGGMSGIVANVPYFIFASCKTTGSFASSPVKLYWKRLDTGQDKYSSGTTSMGSGDTGTSYIVGKKFTWPFDGNIAALAYNGGLNGDLFNGFVPNDESLVRQLGLDPWSIWYPQEERAISVKAPSAGSVGSSDGVGAATAVGKSLFNAVGAASASGAAAAIGKNITNSVASATGAGAASAVGRANFAGVGNATGVGAGTGISVSGTIAQASGVGAATAVGASLFRAVGSASASGAAAAVGSMIAGSVGSATGTGAAAAVGKALFSGVGNAAGVGAGTGISVSGTIAQASGVGAATAVGASLFRSVGSASASGAAAAVGRMIAGSVGSATGTGAAAAVGKTLFSGVGSATGVGAGVGTSVSGTIAQASGVGAATAVGASLFRAVGSASASGAAAAIGVRAGVGVGSATSSGSASAVSKVTASSIGNAPGVGVAVGVGHQIGVGTRRRITPGVRIEGAGDFRRRNYGNDERR